MPQPDFPAIPGGATLDGVKDYLFMLRRRLNDFLAHLDTLNVDELNAQVIIANTITADKMNVTELSAISANIGTITAGSIVANTTITVGTDCTIGNLLKLGESSYTGQKGITFSTDSGISCKISVMSGDFSVITDGFMTFNIGSSQGAVFNKKVTAPSFQTSGGYFVNGVSVATASDISNLQSQINSLSARVTALGG